MTFRIWQNEMQSESKCFASFDTFRASSFLRTILTLRIVDMLQTSLILLSPFILHGKTPKSPPSQFLCLSSLEILTIRICLADNAKRRRCTEKRRQFLPLLRIRTPTPSEPHANVTDNPNNHPCSRTLHCKWLY